MEVLRTTAEKIAPILSDIEGASDVKIEQISGFSQIELHMNRQTMARHMINIENINLLVKTAIGGGVVTIR
jgi:cobalt-zinc-cadmium resistance protein CzcA